MQHPESFDCTHFPRLSLLRASASDFGLQDADAVCLDAILGAAIPLAPRQKMVRFRASIWPMGKAKTG
jgi:hypothetical protein